MLEQDVKHLTSNANYTGFPRKKGEKTGFPYVEYGSAGIAMVVARYFAVTQKQTYRALLERLLPSLNTKYSVLPGLLDGLAGIGHTVLDIQDFLGQENSTEIVKNIRDGVLLHLAERDGYHYFPTMKNRYFDASFGYGNSGIVSFMERLERGGGNPLLFCDECLGV